jgi:hypothetical protein
MRSTRTALILIGILAVVMICSTAAEGQQIRRNPAKPFTRSVGLPTLPSLSRVPFHPGTAAASPSQALRWAAQVAQRARLRQEYNYLVQRYRWLRTESARQLYRHRHGDPGAWRRYMHRQGQLKQVVNRLKHIRAQLTGSYVYVICLQDGEKHTPPSCVRLFQIDAK